jgi:hypothetical protein
MLTRFLRLVMIVLLWSTPLGAVAQQPTTAPTQPLLKPAELDQVLAPIALYPDPLLSEVLIASTYPLEVVQADRWAKSNKALKGDALTAALGKQSWDDSVKSLVQVPDVLSMMSEQLDWAQKLGDAVLAQQADVMEAYDARRQVERCGDAGDKYQILRLHGYLRRARSHTDRRSGLLQNPILRMRCRYRGRSPTDRAQLDQWVTRRGSRPLPFTRRRRLRRKGG